MKIDVWKRALPLLACLALIQGPMTGCSDDTDTGDVNVNPDPDEAVCGNDQCEDGEDENSCPQDCNVEPDPFCGNGECEAGEDEANCPDDCAPDVEGCTEDSDCGVGEICEVDACIDGCREDTDCGGNELCLDNTCIAQGEGCREDEDCNEGFLCNEGTQRCEEDMGQCVDDANEPNDNNAEASDLGEGTFDDLSICGIDNDYYVFALLTGDTLDASILFDGEGGGLDIQIVDADSQPVAQANPVDGGLNVNFVADADADFFVRVFPDANAGEVNNEYVLDVAITPAGEGCEPDGSEPNNSAEDATLLTEGELTDQSACAGDDDFFSFNVGEGQTGTVQVNFDNLAGDLSLVLFQDGVEIDRSEGAGDSESVTATGPGTFVAQVITANVEGGSDYSISLALLDSTDCPLDDFEPNNLIGFAAPVEPGVHEVTVCDGDDDFYAIELGALDTITVTLDFTNANGDIDMEFFGPNEEFLTGSGGTGDQEQIEVEAPIAGTYFISVDMFTDGAQNPYTMTITVIDGPEPPDCDDEFEPNNDADNATELGEGITGATVCTDDPDVFSITVADDNSVVDLVADSELAFGDFDIEFLDTDGETLIDQTFGPNNPEELQVVAPVAGTYFVRVSLTGGETTGYDLSATITPPPDCVDGFEPNDDTDNATPLTIEGLEAAMACIDEVDFYELEILEPFTRVDIIADFENTFGQIDMEILATDGETVLAEANDLGAFEDIDFVFENTGIFYLRVFLGSGVNTAYDLSMDIDILPDCNDEFEPNNSIDEAADVTEGFFDGLSVCDGIDDDDFFAIEITEEVLLDVLITFDDDDGDIDMELLDTDGTTVLDSSRGIDDDEQVEATLQPGTYFVRIFMLSFEGAGEYDMTISFVEPAECLDLNEPNDSFEVATSLVEPIEDAVACVDEVDFYSIIAEEGDSTITVNAIFNAAFGDIDLVLFDTDGTTILIEGNSRGNNETVRFTVDEPGTYFVQAALVDGGQNTTYNISATVIGEVGCEDEFEENDSLGEATPMVPGDYDALTVCRNDNNPQQADRDDFYALFLEAGDSITVDIFFAHADGDIDMRLTDGGGGFLDSSGSTNDNEQVSVTVDVDGFVVIQVLMFSNNRRSVYSMSIDAPERTPPVCQDDNSEPNNDANNATLLDGELTGFQICSGDPDLFRVNVPEGQILRGTLAFTHAEGNLALDLLDTDGETVLTTSDRSGEGLDQEEIIFRAPATDDYFLRVRSAGFDENTYTITSEVVDALPVEECQDRFEPNNSAGTAFPLEPGTHEDMDICFVQDDFDFYAIEIPANSVFNFTASFIADNTDLGVRLFDRDRETLIETIDSFDNDETGRLITGEDNGGTYYLQVFISDFFGDRNTYDLTFTVEENDCLDDGREPDDEPLQAPFLDAGTYAGQICSGDRDLVQFLADEGSVVDAALNFTNADGNLDLRLLDQDGETVLAESTTRFNDTETILARLDEAGIYFFEIVGAGLEQNAYEFTFDFIVCEDDGNEPDNDALNATLLDPGDYEAFMCFGDRDFVQFTATAGQTLGATMRHDAEEGNLNLRLLDQDGETVLQASERGTNSEFLLFTFDEDGLYFMEFSGVDDFDQGAYSFSFDFIEPGDDFCEDAFEPNNVFEDATLVEPGVHFGLGLCRPEPDPEDFYLVELTAGQTVNVLVQFRDDDGDIDLHLRAPDGINNLDTSTGIDDDEEVEFTVLEDGLYVIRVFMFTNPSDNPYIMSVTVTEPDP